MSLSKLSLVELSISKKIINVSDSNVMPLLSFPSSRLPLVNLLFDLHFFFSRILNKQSSRLWPQSCETRIKTNRNLKNLNQSKLFYWYNRMTKLYNLFDFMPCIIFFLKLIPRCCYSKHNTDFFLLCSFLKFFIQFSFQAFSLTNSNKKPTVHPFTKLSSSEANNEVFYGGFLQQM